MEVEIFEIEEMAVAEDGTPQEASDAEAIKLAEEMGLTGQQALVAKTTVGEVRIAYPKLSKAEKRMYEAVFPTKDKIVEYKAGIIPLRVLKEARGCRDLFKELHVWHDGDPANPDPILVGTLGDDQFLIARWGKALESTEKLLKRARERCKEDFKAKASRGLEKAKMFLASLDDQVDRHLRGDWIDLYFGS